MEHDVGKADKNPDQKESHLMLRACKERGERLYQM